MAKKLKSLLPANQKTDYIRKHVQLNIDFDSNFTLSPIFPANFDKLKTVYLPFEMGQFPFFLSNGSKKVQLSRKGYIAYQKMLQLEKSQTSPEEITKQTTYLTSPADTRTKIIDSDHLILGNEDCHPPESEDCKELNKSLTVQCVGWEIVAHQDYGLPNEFDGLVWDFLIRLISLVFDKTNQFKSVYFFKIADIMNDFIANGHYKQQGGRLQKQIIDSLYRIKFTVYNNQKGTYRKDKKTFYPKEDYIFSLISSVYARGEELPDGSISPAFAVAIDPIIMLNFRNQRFLLGMNQLRSSLSCYSAKSLLDRVTFLTFHSFLSTDFFLSYRFRQPFFVLVKYENLCDFLGFKPLENEAFRKSKVISQFESLFSELKEKKIVQDVLYDQFPNAKGEKCFNIFFVLTDEYAFNVINQSGTGFSEKEKILMDKLTEEDIKRYIKKKKGMVHSQELREVLFSEKYIEDRYGNKPLNETLGLDVATKLQEMNTKMGEEQDSPQIPYPEEIDPAQEA